MEIDLSKIVANKTFEGTEESIKDFIPEDLYAIQLGAQTLLLRNPKANKVYTANIGDIILKDCYESFYAVTPKEYEQLLQK